MNKHNPPPEGMPGEAGASTPDPQMESNGSLLAPPEVSCEGLRPISVEPATATSEQFDETGDGVPSGDRREGALRAVCDMSMSFGQSTVSTWRYPTIVCPSVTTSRLPQRRRAGTDYRRQASPALPQIATPQASPNALPGGRRSSPQTLCGETTVGMSRLRRPLRHRPRRGAGARLGVVAWPLMVNRVRRRRSAPLTDSLS